MDPATAGLMKEVLLHTTLESVLDNKNLLKEMMLSETNEKVRKDMAKEICSTLEKTLSEKKPDPHKKMAILTLVKDIMLE
jgi:hypothetical protein